MTRVARRPIMLVIRDGWGSNPHPEWNHANAVHLARTPVDDRLMTEYPHVLIRTSGNDVGLPDGVMGNSEVGHQNIGAGRVVEQELMRITGRIRDGSFYSNPVLVEVFETARRTGGRVHIMGLCSDGRVHSDLDHLHGLLEMCGRLAFPGDRVFVHAFTDGRDTPPMRGLEFVEEIDRKCRDYGVNPIATVIGRYYALDRDNRWERVQTTYGLLTGHHTPGERAPIRFQSAADAVRRYYENPDSPNMTGDEFVAPAVIPTSRGDDGRIRDGDSVIFFNYRGDRPRELTRAFVNDEFPFEGSDKDGTTRRMGFDRGPKLDLYFATMTGYEEGLPVHVAFDKPPRMRNILGSYLADLGLRQFRCAETEKYPHVTFFFNDYKDEPFPGEERCIIPSPRDVATYDQKPRMSAYEVTESVLSRLALGIDDFLAVNYANGDMVGHTGNLQAAIAAVEAVDACVGRLVEAVTIRAGALIVTADHGNCEQMIDPETGGPHTAHTTFDVECIAVDPLRRGAPLHIGGRLADVAPTVLDLLGLPRPEEMTGRTLFTR